MIVGDVDEERLQVLASNVNAAAIRLVTAAKVKAVPGSQFASQLGEVTKGVTAATALVCVERLVCIQILIVPYSLWKKPRDLLYHLLTTWRDTLLICL